MRYLALDRRCIVRMSSERRGRTGIGHCVLSFREQFVDAPETLCAHAADDVPQKLWDLVSSLIFGIAIFPNVLDG